MCSTFEAEQSELAAEADAIAKTLASDYRKAAGALVALLTKLEAAEERIRVFNRRVQIDMVGDPVAEGLGLPHIESRAWAFRLAPHTESVLTVTRPRKFDDPSMPAWPIEGHRPWLLKG